MGLVWHAGGSGGLGRWSQTGAKAVSPDNRYDIVCVLVGRQFHCVLAADLYIVAGGLQYTCIPKMQLVHVRHVSS